MAVTSDQLLAFIERASTVEIHLDAEGEVVMQTPLLLEGDALAKALSSVADLAAHEGGLGFARQQFEAHQMHAGGSVIPFPGGPRAN